MQSKHPRSTLWAVLAIATGAFACKDTTTPREISTPEIAGPSFTLGVGFSGATVGRGNVGAFHINSKSDGYHVDLKSRDNTDILVTNLAIAPGGHSGWHSHPGPVLVIVKTGTITLYQGHDRKCTGTPHVAGTVFVEKGGEVHIARNEGATEVTMVASAFLPAGGPGRIDEAASRHCEF